MGDLPPEPDLSRRKVLGLLGGGAALLATGCLPELPFPIPQLPVPGTPTGVRSLVLRRRDDQLRIGVQLHDAEIVRVGSGQVIRPSRRARTTPLVVFDLGPQSVTEEAFVELNGVTPVPPPPIGSRLSRPTRLAYFLDEDVPLTVDGLLDWALRPSLVASAASGAATPMAPSARQTAIEVPWRLILSPSAFESWRHEHGARTVAGRTELWHTTLERRLPSGLPAPAHVRAVYALDEALPRSSTHRNLVSDDDAIGEGKPFRRMALGPKDRIDIVRHSSVRPVGAAVPPAIDVDRLTLSSMGAWYDLSGEWTASPANSMASWQHRGTMGREHYARVDRVGWLFPYGHRAVKITITERKFNRAPSGPRGAYLHQRTFLVITQRSRRFAGGDSADYGGAGRDLPFETIECTTRTTPDFYAALVGAIPASEVVLPLVAQGGPPMELGFVGTDWAGRRHGFAAPVVFASLETTALHFKELTNWFNDPSGLAPALRDALITLARRPMPGDEMAIAEPRGGDPGSTSFAVKEVHLGVLRDETPADGVAPFVPKLMEARGSLPQSSAFGGTPEVTLEYFDDFVDKGFGTAGVNQGEMFAQIAGATVDLAEGTATGLLNGALATSGLSRTAGAVAGDLGAIAGGIFTPASLLDAFSGRLLGVVALKDLVPVPTVPSIDGPPPDAMTITNRRADDLVETHLRWTPKLQAPAAVPVFKVVPAGPNGDATGPLAGFFDGPSKFSLDLRSRTDLADPSASSLDIAAELANVRLDLVSGAFSFLIIDVRRIRFTAGSGRKPDVDVDLLDVGFGESLEFVKDLAQYVTTGGLGPTIDATADGVLVEYAMALPSLQIGIFALQNLSFAVGAYLPFGDDPLRVRASFSSRDNPFMLTVSMFGGGGWASMVLGPDKVEALDIGLEFGASASLDIGVASGSVSITAGVYIAVGEDEQGRTNALLEGFLRLCGELDVMGLVSVSAEFYMALTYISQGKKVHGRATLTIEVDVLMFSDSVKLTVERYFSSDPGDPTFADLMPGDDAGSSPAWDEYCQAFAPREAH